MPTLAVALAWMRKPAVELPGDLVDALLESRGEQVTPVAEDAALGVIAGFDQTKALAGRENVVAARSEAPEIDAAHQPGPRIAPDKLSEGAEAVADKFGKELLREGEDVSVVLVREMVIEHTHFERAGSVALHEHRRPAVAQVILRL